MFCNIPLMQRLRKEKMQRGVGWRPEEGGRTRRRNEMNKVFDT